MKDVPIVHVLVLHGADLEAFDYTGKSILHLESTLRTREIASLVLDKGMDINIKDEVSPTLYT